MREVVRERVVVVDEEDHRLLRLRELDRRFERRELVQALLMLFGRIRVGDDPSSGLEPREPVTSTIVRIAMHVSSAPPGSA